MLSYLIHAKIVKNINMHEKVLAVGKITRISTGAQQISGRALVKTEEANTQGLNA